MRRHTAIFAALLSMALCVSCGSSGVPGGQDPVQAETGSRPVTFVFGGFTAVSGDLPVTRASLEEANVKFLTLKLFDSGGNAVFSAEQSAGDSGFGSVTGTLDYGTYTLVAVANGGDARVDVESPDKAGMPSGSRVADTFWVSRGLSVSASSESSVSLTLARPVAAVVVRATDASMPSGFDHFELELSGGSTSFDPSTGYGIAPASGAAVQTYTAAKGALNNGIYTFPVRDGSCTLVVRGCDASGNAIRTHTIAGIGLSANRMVTYSGHFFVSETAFSVSVENEWTKEEKGL